jgi:leucyl-tRNA synthetase
MADYSKEEIKRMERKWREQWQKRAIYKVDIDRSSPKYYVLDMFPYPSGAGLHVGHPLGYIASDIVSRYKRLKGFNVLHPMGFDAFGLPAEQYAIQTGQHPAVTTAKNIETYKRQLKQIGLSFDWDREVQTSDPAFYKWTQWIFMQLFNAWYNRKSDGTEGKAEPIENLIKSFERNGNRGIDAVCDEGTPPFTREEWLSWDEKTKENILQHYRIAYLSEATVNWCPALGTVLSNDEVKDGISERGGYPVERIEMLQWSMRISAYAERLLKGLDTIDWPEPVKEMQRNWIGKSVGCELDFAVEESTEKIRVFTTRIDTIYGVTFMVLAPEHKLVDTIVTSEQRQKVMDYIDFAKNRSERERLSEVKKISGVFTGTYCLNPFNHERVPIWIADYVLVGYGTGAVMAVPSSDSRDYAFASHFNLPIVDILKGPASDITKDNFDPKSGTMINSELLNGLPWNEAVEKALQHVEELGIGIRKVNYRMRDAIFGRQRYWGEPFPVYYKDSIPHLVNEEDLPVTLPEIDEYKPTETGEPPLARAKDWRYHPTRTISKAGGREAGYPYEHTTMPGWAGSSWYWYRYMDPSNEIAFCSKEAESYWRDVDLYMGGSEHATGHLLYSRFWCKALKDLGYVQEEEPFKKMINQGHIQGVSRFAYRLATNSKIKKNLFVSQSIANRIRSSEMTQLDKKVINSFFPDLDFELEIVTNLNLLERYPAETYVLLAISPIRIDINLYDESKGLNIDGLRNSIFNDFKNAEFILEDENQKPLSLGEDQGGAYICGSEIEKMSKTKLNVVNPDDIVDKYGADTLRMYEMFLGPLELSKPWSTNGIDGVYKFLRRFWNLFHDEKSKFNLSDAKPSGEELKVLHRTIKKVEEDINRFSFNTAISEFMICANELTSLKCNKRAVLEPLVIALSPFAPHIAEELWELLGHDSLVLKTSYPLFDEQFLIEDSFEYPISINGKVRTKMNFALDMPKQDIEKLVLASEAIHKWIEGKTPKKVIIVPGKIVNVVI